MTKKTYEAPQLAIHGSIAELTQGGSTGTHSDRDYPISIPANGSFAGFLS